MSSFLEKKNSGSDVKETFSVLVEVTHDRKDPDHEGKKPQEIKLDHEGKQSEEIEPVHEVKQPEEIAIQLFMKKKNLFLKQVNLYKMGRKLLLMNV